MVTTTQNIAETLRPLVGELMMLFQESAEFQRQRGNPHAQAVLQEATRMVAANSRRQTALMRVLLPQPFSPSRW